MRLRAMFVYGPPGLVINPLLIAIMIGCLRLFAQTRFEIRVDGVTVRPFGIHVPAAAISEISEPAHWYRRDWLIHVRRLHRRWFEFPAIVGIYEGPKPEDAPDILRPGTTAWTNARGGPWMR